MLKFHTSYTHLATDVLFFEENPLLLHINNVQQRSPPPSHAKSDFKSLDIILAKFTQQTLQILTIHIQITFTSDCFPGDRALSFAPQHAGCLSTTETSTSTSPPSRRLDPKPLNAFRLAPRSSFRFQYRTAANWNQVTVVGCGRRLACHGR